MKARSFMRALLGLTLLAAAYLPPADAFARAVVSAARLGSHPDNVTRVVMDLSDTLTYTTQVQAGPDRIVVVTGELDWTDASAARRSFGSVQGVRYDGGRIVIDLKEPALIKSSFLISPRDGQGWRLVIDVQRATRPAFLAAAQPAVADPPPSATTSRPLAAAQTQAVGRATAPTQDQRAIVVYSPAVQPNAGQPAPVAARPVSTAAAAPAQPAAVAASQAAPVSPPPVPEPAPKSEPAPKAEPAAVPEPTVPEPTSPPATVTAATDTPVPASRPRATTAGTPLMSAPVPPPLARPVVEVSTPPVAVAAPPSAPPPPAPPLPALAKAAPEQAALPARAAAAPPQPRSPRNEGRAVIVLDPGHGGVDPGALGVSGIYEKHITLAMARELKTQLERSGRYKVHLTRDRDVFIRLRERVAIARQYGADLFISLHADSVGNPQLAGLSVYTLSQNASDTEAQALADKENKADLIAGFDLSHESADIANILIDLAQRETMNRSAGFAGGVVDELGRETTLLGNTHRFAGFAVLKAPDIPSILVELGYLSNPNEERLLRQPDYRAKLAKGIARAVDRHFLEGQKARRP